MQVEESWRWLLEWYLRLLRKVNLKEGQAAGKLVLDRLRKLPPSKLEEENMSLSKRYNA
jgi:hypothetical protein